MHTAIVHLIHRVDKYHEALLFQLREPSIASAENGLQGVPEFVRIRRNFAFLQVENFVPEAKIRFNEGGTNVIYNIL